MSAAVGARIRDLRTERLLTQAELADRVCVHREQVTRWEGGGEIRARSIRKLARALGVSFEYLRGY